jgi:hypothetical protein
LLKTSNASERRESIVGVGGGDELCLAKVILGLCVFQFGLGGTVKNADRLAGEFVNGPPMGEKQGLR